MPSRMTLEGAHLCLSDFESESHRHNRTEILQPSRRFQLAHLAVDAIQIMAAL
jgi:hypothetical protein